MNQTPRKILVADDEEDVRQFVVAALEDNGYEFVLAADGREAVAKAKEESPDLVVMDVQMPRQDGFGALYELRQDPATAHIPVVLLTGVAEKTGVKFSAETVEEYMGERPDAFFDKPVDPVELRDAVEKLIARHHQ